MPSNSKRKAQDMEDGAVDEYIPAIDYNSVISDERAEEYVDGRRPTPLNELDSALNDTKHKRDEAGVNKSVIFWYRQDLRVHDNRALSKAYQAAAEANVPLICVYLYPLDLWDKVAISNCRVDFIGRTLEKLRVDLKKLNIALVVQTSHNCKKDLVDLAKKYNAGHIYANIEYEVYELRRDAKIVRAAADQGIAVKLAHDTCVVKPGELVTKTSNKPFSVFSPFYKSWIQHLCDHTALLEEATPKLDKKLNELDGKYKHLMDDFSLPCLPPDYSLGNDAEYERWRKMWPAGEDEAHKVLDKWVTSKALKEYNTERHMLEPPHNDRGSQTSSTSGMSVYLATGNIPARALVRQAVGFENKSKTGKLNKIYNLQSSGVANWVSEVAWRDFYRAILVHFPYVCMNKPFKLKTEKVHWSDNKEYFQRWMQGRTGYPIVDAAMRQIVKTGYLHNRGRMIVASFLTKDLLINWQWGEYFFMKVLIDGDFASNNGGWGFSASTGVDAQPYFRIFNPLRQSERFDPNGDYIRKWVPELKDFDGHDIHEPYSRNPDLASASGYPKPIVSHSMARDKALEAFQDSK